MTDTRPFNCRHRAQDEGRPYPRSSCSHCGKTITTGLGRHCEFGHVTADPAPSPSPADDVAGLCERLNTGSDLVTTGEVVAMLTSLAAEQTRGNLAMFDAAVAHGETKLALKKAEENASARAVEGLVLLHRAEKAEAALAEMREKCGGCITPAEHAEALAETERERDEAYQMRVDRVETAAAEIDVLKVRIAELEQELKDAYRRSDNAEFGR